MNYIARYFQVVLAAVLAFSISNAKPQDKKKSEKPSEPKIVEPQKPKPTTTLDRPASFATLLLNEDAFRVINEKLPVGCADALKEIYQSGKTLESKTLYDASLPVLEVETLTRNRDLSFFHWTSSRGRDALGKLFHQEVRDRDEAHRMAIKEQAYEQVFKYLRASPDREKNRHTPTMESLWPLQWYFSESSTGSRSYGQYLLEIQVSETARILRDTDPAWQTTVKEIKENFPNVARACELRYAPQDTDSYGCSSPRASIYFIIAEDSNIDFIDYRGCGTTTYGNYFQLLSPKNIKKLLFH